MGCVCTSNANVTKGLEEVIEGKTPLAFVQELLTDSERRQMLLACGELGEDPSSKYFVKRTKSIAYVVHIHDRWFQVTVDYFIQPSQYNDFSGGYRRSYKLLPSSFIECEATQKMLNEFKSVHNVPSGELVLCQVQTSHIGINSSMPGTKHKIAKTLSYDIHVNPPNMEQERSETLADPLVVSNSYGSAKSGHAVPDASDQEVPDPDEVRKEYSITGQGIHTDGCDVCALVCLKRENINGCENSVYYDLEGNEKVLDSFVLKEKNVLYWKDNKVYHYVNPASLINEDKDGIRTVVLMSYPIIFMVDGETNPNNTLGRKLFGNNRQLRNQQK